MYICSSELFIVIEIPSSARNLSNTELSVVNPNRQVHQSQGRSQGLKIGGGKRAAGFIKKYFSRVVSSGDVSGGGFEVPQENFEN